jgi:hypothetical protein
LSKSYQNSFRQIQVPAILTACELDYLQTEIDTELILVGTDGINNRRVRNILMLSLTLSDQRLIVDLRQLEVAVLLLFYLVAANVVSLAPEKSMWFVCWVLVCWCLL